METRKKKVVKVISKENRAVIHQWLDTALDNSLPVVLLVKSSASGFLSFGWGNKLSQLSAARKFLERHYKEMEKKRHENQANYFATSSKTNG